MFHVTVLNPKRVMFEGDVESVFLPGDDGEFELLTYHAPIVSLLTEGDLVVDWQDRIPIKRGMAKFFYIDCVGLADT